MTQEGETKGFTISDHIKVLYRHGRVESFDMCLSNIAPVSQQVLEKYALEGASQLFADRDAIESMGIKLHEAPLIMSGSALARHNPRLTAREIFKIFF